MTLGDLKKEHPILVQRMKDAGIKEADFEKVYKVLINTCFSCFEYDRNCQCWNDE